MHKANPNVVVLLLVAVIAALLGHNAGRADTTTVKRYSGTEVGNLTAVIENHTAQLIRISDDLGRVCGMLNSDAGVTWVNFAPTNSGSNTFLNVDRR